MTTLDTTNLVASYSIDRGRSFELDRTDTGTAQIAINDIHGVLDPTNTTGPYYGLIEPYLQMAIALDNPVTSTTHTLFRGYIEDYDYDEDPSQKVARLNLSLVDAFAPLSAIEMQPGQFGETPPAGSEGQIFFEAAQVDDLMIRVLARAAWPEEFTTIFSGNVRIQDAVYSPGDTVLQVIQDCADAEFPGVGNVYVSKDGKITFHGRMAKFDPSGVSAGAGGAWDFHHWACGDGAAVAASPSTTAQIREFSFNRGISKVINSALATPQGIDDADIEGQLVQDSASIGLYGIHSWSAENLLTDAGTTTGNDANDECKAFAQYYIANYASPRNRISKLTFKSMAPEDPRAAANWNLICNVEISDRIDVTITNPGGGGFNLEPFFVEGIHYEVQPATTRYNDVTLTLDVSPMAYFTDGSMFT